MRSEFQLAVLRFLEREAGLQLVALIGEGRLHRHQPRLAIVHQGFQVLFRKLFPVNAALAQLFPVHLVIRYQVLLLRLLLLLLLCRFLYLFRRRSALLGRLYALFLFQFFHCLLCFLLYTIFVSILFFRLLRSLLFHSLRFGVFSFRLLRFRSLPTGQRFRLLLVFGSVHLVRREHFRVCRRVFQ